MIAWSPAAAAVVVLLAAPALPGIAARTRALLTGRRGAPVLQLYADISKLLRKGAVYGEATSWPFRAAPAVVLGALLLAMLLLPLDGHAALVGFQGDLIVFAALLALARFALTLAGLDTGSSFEGMGVSRELAFASIAEPVLFLCFIALVLATGTLSLGGMLGAPLGGVWRGAAPSLAMVAIALFVLLLTECSRGPVDDPTTHLELTMIHEVIVLEHSGPDLALLLYAGALKLALFGALVVGVLAPRGALGAPASVALLALGLAATAVAVGIVESAMARLRLDRVPQLIVTAGALAILGITLLLH